MVVVRYNGMILYGEMSRVVSCGASVVREVNDFSFRTRLGIYINQARKRGGGGCLCCISPQIERNNQLILTVLLRIV